LSLKASFQSLMTIAAVGRGKTSAFVIPNIFTLDKGSLVITDTSGELYEQCSGYLKHQGFEIICLNLFDVKQSHGYNPLHNPSSFSEISKLAHLIIRSSSATGNANDQYWTAGAETILRILIQCLKNKGDDDVCTLGRIKQLLNTFDHFVANGSSQFDKFVMDATLDDQLTWENYKGFLAAPEKTVLSFVATANTALMALGNPDLVELTNTHQIDFQSLREKRTALFVMARQQDMSSLGFILNAFFTDLFHTMMKDLNPKLPVFMLLDEFGNLFIPKFSVIASTARKYKLAFWLFLQSEAQLVSQYGQTEAQTIKDALGTEIYLAGVGLETAERLSRRMGRKRPSRFQSKIKYEDGALMNPDEIISMRDNQALMFHGNKRPLQYRVKPFYKHRYFSRLAKYSPAEFPSLRPKREPPSQTPVITEKISPMEKEIEPCCTQTPE